MRRGQNRHPALEIAVFAAALLLTAFVGRELWRRRGPVAAPRAVPQASGPAPAELNVVTPPLIVPQAGSRTEVAVNTVPSLKVNKVQRPKRRPAVVPLPQ